jgi:hypothetical protein
MGWILIKTYREGESILTDEEIDAIKTFLSCSSFPLHANAYDKVVKATTAEQLQVWENEGGTVCQKNK